MIQLTLPADLYTYNSDKQSYTIVKPRLVGIYELLWLSITTSPIEGLNKKEFKVIKRLKNTLSNVGEWKDLDKDARILQTENAIILLETDEFEMLVRLIDAHKFSVRVVDELTELWSILENATTVSPKLVVGSNE